jgi:WD40 repeat protein/putative methionine-R-sulfoxide reductase with GAF domain
VFSNILLSSFLQVTREGKQSNRMARRSAQLAIVDGQVQEVIPTSAFLNHVMHRICSLTQADGVAVATRDQRGVICRASMGNAPEVGSRMQPDSALTRECFETGQLVISGDVDKDYRIDRAIARSLNLRSAVVVPLRTRDSVFGVLEVFSARAFAFDQTQVAGLQRVAEGLAPLLAEALSTEPAEGIRLALPPPEERKSKAHPQLVAGAILLSVTFLLLIAVFHRRQTKAPYAPSSPLTSAPPRQSQSQQAQQAQANEEPSAKPHDSVHSDLSATTSSSFSASLPAKPNSASNAAQPEKPLTTGNPPDVIHPPVPALVIQGAPPGAQVFVDGHLVSATNSEGQASISALATGQHDLRVTLEGYLDYDQGIEVREDQTSTVVARLEAFPIPASDVSVMVPLVAGTPAIPALVTSTRNAEPDFMLERSLKGHSGWVTTIAFSPDGKRLASGSWDQTVKLWEPSTGQQLSTSKMKEIQALAFSRDGRWLAIENSSNTVTLRDATTGQEIRALASDKPLGPLGSNWVYSIAFSPDGQWLATGLDDKTVRLWDVNTGRKVRDFTTSRRHITYIAFSPDGRLLASGDDDRTITIWNTLNGAELQKLSGHRKPVYSVAFSPNGSLLASASGDKTVRLWDLARGREIHILAGHDNAVTSLAFSPDGRWLASGSWDETIKIWDVETGRELRTLAGHGHRIYSVAFDSRGGWLGSGSEDGTIKLWRLTKTADQSSSQR